MEELSSVHADSSCSALGVQRSDFMGTKIYIPKSKEKIREPLKNM